MCEVMQFKDERMKVQNELLNALKTVKEYGWEPQLAARVRVNREKELEALKKAL